MIQRMKMTYRLSGIVDEPCIEFVTAADGSKICVHPADPQLEIQAPTRVKAGNVLSDIPMPIIWTRSSVIPVGELGA
jgi:hypothetical protein